MLFFSSCPARFHYKEMSVFCGRIFKETYIICQATTEQIGEDNYKHC